ncbi:MAG TPA: nitric-oxide reductase large subunit, partial [bacterium]|nr:nitric-oxide reductase large subunit [bacterium]
VAVLVVIVGLTVLMCMGRNVYQGAPPIPEKVADSSGKVLFTGEDILSGQGVFQRYGLMDYGSVFGHGAYRGPDFTDDYLHRSAWMQRDAKSYVEFKKPYATLADKQKAQVDQLVVVDAKANRYDEATKTLTWTQEQARALPNMVTLYEDMFLNGGGDQTLPKNYLKNAEEVRQLTTFFAWTAWAASAQRPGKDYSYTNNWPPEDAVGNRPTRAVFLWTVLSLISLLGGTALVLMFFGRFDYLGWGGDGPERVKSLSLKDFQVTPSQVATYKYFLIVAVLFAFQALMGVFTAHYFVEATGFYGIDIRDILPTTITRSWHLQLSIFWIATAWLAAGLFMAPFIGKREPKHQAFWVNVLFGAVVLVAVGSIVGEWLGVKAKLGNLWFWFGHQGWEYLELGRFWQMLLTAGMVIWAILVIRTVWGKLKGQDKGSMPYLLVYAILAIPLMFSFGMIYTPHTNFAVADFWRWWVVHLWVEGFFELFTTIVVAYFFVILGLVTTRTALRVVYLDILLYLGSGMIGTGHHYYWTAQPAINLALGAFFSAMEVVPLLLLTLEGYDFAKLRRGEAGTKEADGFFAHYWAIMFLIAVGFWNFVGAGIFGFLINLPIVSYYEHATYLTPNHGHAALMGVYGNLAVAALVFVLRFLVKPEHWSNRLLKISFWSIQIGLMMMLLLDIFPVGLLEMVQSYTRGYWFARSVDFWNQPLVQDLTWARVAGDSVFVLGGVLPLLYFTARSMFYLKKPDQAS